MSKLNPLNSQEERVIIRKGTEMPFTGEYTDLFADGLYICKQCNSPLYLSHDKFHSGCGWPSFDDEIPGMVKRNLDADGRRVEIVCSTCEGHLGHVFEGERLTEKNERHCVNSISMKFVTNAENTLQRAIFASGCFWSKEYIFSRIEGVLATRVGYTGGKIKTPTYREVSSGMTGHAETVEIYYDKNKVSFEQLAKTFFESHDPSVASRQGEAQNGKYRSAIFYANEEQRLTAEKLIQELKDKGLNVVTQLAKAEKFYKAENQHQKYYDRLEKEPENLYHEKRFV